MKTSFRVARIAAVLGAVVLIAAACSGGSSDQDQPPVAQDTEEPAPLPLNDDPGDTPAIAGACAVGEPDCNDTPVAGDDEPVSPLPTPEPPTDTVGGFLVEGGLSVSEALVTEATGVIVVRGFLFDDGAGARLCELLAESFPPQCGGAELPVTGYEEVIAVPLTTSQGVTWTDHSVSLFGEIIDGTFVVDPNLAG